MLYWFLDVDNLHKYTHFSPARIKKTFFQHILYLEFTRM